MRLKSAYDHLDLFSGIGGFALAARWNGLRTIQFVEYEPYAQKVLKKNFPDVPIHEDIKDFDATQFRQPFLCTGGYPCQPFSNAGLRRGEKDDRHLWPEMLRVIQECRPTWVLAENVAGHITMGLDEVLSDLEGEDYSCQPFVIPACAKDANHRRDRVWIVGNANTKRHSPKQGYGKTDETEQFRSSGTSSSRKIFGNSESKHGNECREYSEPSERSISKSEKSGSKNFLAHSISRRCEERESETKSHPRLNCESQRTEQFWLPEPDVGRVAHGISNRVDRLRGLGNAIVPQVASEIIRAMVRSS